MTIESAQWLGLQQVSETEWFFELTGPLCRHDGRLYGGSGIAAAITAMEASTGQHPVWITVQFAGTALLGERIDYTLETLAAGRRTSQIRFSASAGGRVILAGVGAAGVYDQAKVADMQVPTMPDVPGPQDGKPWGSNFQTDIEGMGWTNVAELIEVDVDPRRTYIWARMRNGLAAGPAEVAFMADIVPPSVLRAVGQSGAGTSLDNSVRFGHAVETEWVLYEFDPWFIAGGYLHGGVRAWSESGEIVGYANQTASGYLKPPVDSQ